MALEPIGKANAHFFIGSKAMNEQKSGKSVRQRGQIREKTGRIQTVAIIKMDEKIAALLSMKRQDTEQ